MALAFSIPGKPIYQGTATVGGRRVPTGPGLGLPLPCPPRQHGRSIKRQASTSSQSSIVFNPASPSIFRYPGEHSLNLSEYMVVLDKPIGLTLAPDPTSGQITVQSIQPGSPAAQTGMIQVGDVVRMCSAVFGEDMWQAVDIRRLRWAINNRTSKIKLVLERTRTPNEAPSWYSRGQIGRCSQERDMLQLPARFTSTQSDDWSQDMAAPGRPLMISFHSLAQGPNQAWQRTGAAAIARSARLQLLREELADARREPELELGTRTATAHPGSASSAQSARNTGTLPPRSGGTNNTSGGAGAGGAAPSSASQGGASGSSPAGGSKPGSAGGPAAVRSNGSTAAVTAGASSSNSNSSNSGSASGALGRFIESLAGGMAGLPNNNNSNSSNSSNNSSNGTGAGSSNSSSATPAAAASPAPPPAAARRTQAGSRDKKVIPVLPWLLVSSGRLDTRDLTQIASQRGLSAVLELGMSKASGVLAVRGSEPGHHPEPGLHPSMSQGVGSQAVGSQLQGSAPGGLPSRLRGSASALNQAAGEAGATGLSMDVKHRCLMSAAAALQRLMVRRLYGSMHHSPPSACNVLLHCAEPGLEADVACLLAAWLHWYACMPLQEALLSAEIALGCAIEQGIIESATEALVAAAEERCNRVVLTWKYGGLTASIAGDPVGSWSSRMPLVKCKHPMGCKGSVARGNFYVELTGLRPGLYYYKYIVDGSWAVDPTAPKVLDASGNWNNVLEVHQRPPVTSTRERLALARWHARRITWETKLGLRPAV